MANVTWIEHVGEWLGTQPGSELDLAKMAEDQLSVDVIATMSNVGLTPNEVYSLVIPQRTLKHRKSRRERLSREESDRAIRAARVLATAQQTFGERARALNWLREPKKRFGGRTPIHMLTTESGGRLVEEMLIQIDEGMFG